MKKILLNKKKSCLFINNLFRKDYFGIGTEVNYDKRIKRLDLKLEKLLVEDNIKELKNKFKNESRSEDDAKLEVSLLEERKGILKRDIKSLEKQLFDKNNKENIVNKKFVVLTNNKGFNAFTFDNTNSILNKNKSFENIQFWLSNLPENLCKKAYYNYFLEKTYNETLSDSIAIINENVEAYEESYFRNELIEDFDMSDNFKILDFLDFNFFNEKDSLNLLKLIVSSKCIGDLYKENISLKAYKPSKYILSLLNPILDRKINSIYELKVKDLSILLAEVNKL